MIVRPVFATSLRTGLVRSKVHVRHGVILLIMEVGNVIKICRTEVGVRLPILRKTR